MNLPIPEFRESCLPGNPPKRVPAPEISARLKTLTP